MAIITNWAGREAQGELEFNSNTSKYDYRIVYIQSSKLDVTGKWVLYVKGKTDNGEGSVYIMADFNPTSNCQLALIGSAFRLFEFKTESMMEIIKDFARLMNKNIIMVDVNRSVANQFVTAFGDHIMLNSQYQSTNGSNMNVILINVQHLLK